MQKHNARQAGQRNETVEDQFDDFMFADSDDEVGGFVRTQKTRDNGEAGGKRRDNRKLNRPQRGRREHQE